MQPFPKTSASFRHEGTREPANKAKASCIARGENRYQVVCKIGGESEALGFHQETTEDQENNKIGFVSNFTLFRIRLPEFGCIVLANVISTKTLF